MRSTSYIGFLLFMALIVNTNGLWAQQKMWVFLKDKGTEQAYWQAHPEAYLSAKALQRQGAVGHVPTLADLPVSTTYKQQLSTAGVKVLGSSRWINALSVETTLSLRQLKGICPAVTGMRKVGKFSHHAYETSMETVTGATGVDSIAYGQALDQTNQLNLQCLHSRGFTGRDVLIAVFDAGFLRMDTIAAFDSLWLQGRVLTYRDFVNQDYSVFDEHNHGMNVASTIVANVPGIMVGTAPHATLILARTENVFSETHQEEDNWLMAAEWADSLGADQIHSSLGYTSFDPGEGDFVYADLDGNTTIISRAADMAAARGILVVNSAGNEGGGPWRHISAPCDGDSVLCVGAVDITGAYVGFSGVGPSADGQIKPDVVAMGLNVAAVGNTGVVGNTSGTSFSAPIMSGFAACLKQAHPLRSNMQILHAIQQSSSQYATPDSLVGYGIPNACKADSLLRVLDSLVLSVQPISQQLQQVTIFPNPATETLILENRLASNLMSGYTVIAIDGRVVQQTSIKAQEGMHATIPLKAMASGVYFVRIALASGQVQVSRFIKE
jgi:serine protease AprX